MTRRVVAPEPSSGWQKDKCVFGRKTGNVRTQAHQLTGWNIPTVTHDDNDIVSWMKREKNGDNRRKNTRESSSQEQFRHVFDLCSAIENKHLFERQILHCDRYPRTCQHRPQDERVSKVTPAASKPADHEPIEASDDTRPSTAAVADKGLAADGKTQSAVCEGRGGKGREAVLPPEGSRREVKKGVTYAASGTFPHAAPMMKNEAAKDDGNGAHDDGYGSKGSTNDNEDEDVGKGSLKTNGSSENTPPEDGRFSPAAIAMRSSGKEPARGACLHRCSQDVQHEQHDPQQGQLDSTAKIRYSRAEKTVYERARDEPRSRGRGLEHPDGGTVVQSGVGCPSALTQLASHQPVGVASHQQQQVSAGPGALMPRIMVLRKITIQDAMPEAFAQDAPPFTSHVPRVRKGHSYESRLQQQRALQARSAPDLLTSSQSGKQKAPREDLYSNEASEPPTASPWDSTSGESDPPQKSSCASVCNKGRSQILPFSFGSGSCSGSGGGDGDGSSGGGAGAGYNWYNDKMPPSLPMTDLLPAVERKIQRTRAAQREVAVDNLNQLQMHQQQLPQQLLPWQCDLEPRVSSEASDCENGPEYGRGKTHVKCHSRALGIEDSRAGVCTDFHSLGTETVPSLPSFRPHYSVSPLQRARIIAHRRLHGYLTQQPDGSETITVSSPRYPAQGDHKYNASRTRSGCRLLGQVLSRQASESNYS